MFETCKIDKFLFTNTKLKLRIVNIQSKISQHNDIDCEQTDVLFALQKIKPRKPERGELAGFLLKSKNSGNQPEFQSSIKKRTVNQTVVTFHPKLYV